jgi:uncharacterized protein (DUF1501 family)
MEIKTEKPVWVVVFLRGGMDGLSLVYPSSGKDREIYEAERPTLKITPNANEPAFKLSETLSFHPSAKELFSLYEKKSLAVIHAVGLTADSRSHFDAQNIMEQGADSKAHLLQSGWIARYLNAEKPKSKIAAVSIGNVAPTSIFTYDQSLVIDGIRNHRFPIQPKYEADFERSLRSLYALQAPVRPWLSEWGLQTLDTLDDLKELASKPGDSNYPKGELAGKLQTLSRLLIEKPEIEMATVDMGGWDTHKFQGAGIEGTFGNLVAQLSQALSYFYDEVSKKRPVIITVQTEFGRRLKENFSRGTDHGHGGVMLLLGDTIKGGEVYGKWPGLDTEKLYQRADLAVTSDYRNVMSELLLKTKNFAHSQIAFPGFKPNKPLGIV